MPNDRKEKFLKRKASSDKLLQIVQANIFKSHSRDFVWCLFFQFTESDYVKNRQIFQQFATSIKHKITSGYEQKSEADKYRSKLIRKEDLSLVRCLFISSKGMNKLAVPFNEEDKDIPKHPYYPKDDSFIQGMADEDIQRDLKDNIDDNWECNYKPDNNEIHFMVLIADNSHDKLNTEHKSLLQFLTKEHTCKLLFVERGKKLFNDKKENIEPFGYRDGLSKIPFWTKDNKLLLQKARKIVLDEQKGSYLVFRKLEQNVKAFNSKVNSLTYNLFYSDDCNLKSILHTLKELDIEDFLEKRKNVEAQLMGRFKDGTPIALFDAPILENNLATSYEKLIIKMYNSYKSNHYRYLNMSNHFGKDRGVKCPLHAHTRKTNPRNKRLTKKPIGYKSPKDIEIRIARRGIPYKEQNKTNKSKEGMLFMSYQASIQFQFEVINNQWCLDSIFPSRPGEEWPGVDPIAEHRNKNGLYTWIRKWGSHQDKKIIPTNFNNIVTPRGGEYFYAPSISWIRDLDKIPETPIGDLAIN